MPNNDFILNYAMPHRSPEDQARIRLWENNGKTICLISQMGPDYQGVSVTNGSEHIATELARNHGVSPSNTIYVEHYPAFDNEDRKWGKPSFDIVSWTWTKDNRAMHPQWKPSTKRQVEAWVGEEIE